MSADCECRITEPAGGQLEIDYCPTHEAAFETAKERDDLLAALKDNVENAKGYLEVAPTTSEGGRYERIRWRNNLISSVSIASAAIARAEGEKA